MTEEQIQVFSRVLDFCREGLKKKDYQLYRDAASHLEVEALRAVPVRRGGKR